MKNSAAGGAAGRGGTQSGRRNLSAAGFRGRGDGALHSPCAQRRGVEAPNAGPSARQQAACERRRLCSWNETRRPAASASKPETTSASASGYTNTPGAGAGGTGGVRPRAAPLARPSPRPGLTVHRLRLRVVVGEPGPQAEAGAVGAGPDPGVGERQRRPAGGAVQAGHGAPGRGDSMKGSAGWGHGRQTPPS